MQKNWLTPEEIHAKREQRKSLFYLLIPVCAIAIGGLIALLSQSTY